MIILTRRDHHRRPLDEPLRTADPKTYNDYKAAFRSQRLSPDHRGYEKYGFIAPNNRM